MVGKLFLEGTMVVMFRFQNVDGQIFRVAELAHMGGEGRDPQEEEGGDKRTRQGKERKDVKQGRGGRGGGRRREAMI